MTNMQFETFTDGKHNLALLSRIASLFAFGRPAPAPVRMMNFHRQTLRVLLRRSMATAAPSAGPARESTFVRVWVKEPSAWPIIAITGGALVFSGYKIYHDLFNTPDYHFNRAERSTIDYVENDKDPSLAMSWGESAFHKGPKFIRERLIKRE